VEINLNNPITFFHLFVWPQSFFIFLFFSQVFSVFSFGVVLTNSESTLRH
jgi:hypothetical protein